MNFDPHSPQRMTKLQAEHALDHELLREATDGDLMAQMELEERRQPDDFGGQLPSEGWEAGSASLPEGKLQQESEENSEELAMMLSEIASIGPGNPEKCVKCNGEFGEDGSKSHYLDGFCYTCYYD